MEFQFVSLLSLFPPIRAEGWLAPAATPAATVGIARGNLATYCSGD